MPKGPEKPEFKSAMSEEEKQASRAMEMSVAEMQSRAVEENKAEISGHRLKMRVLRELVEELEGKIKNLEKEVEGGMKGSGPMDFLHESAKAEDYRREKGL
ncbi:MAG: hypothetical protein KGI60_01835 [Patescibacteria group bacterium]|nr:hypothetical protein [Patescibacteria group bacterium]